MAFHPDMTKAIEPLDGRPTELRCRHDKDYPSYWEACYYLGGSDEGVLRTPDGNVGVALCFEFVRSRTARRLRGRVGMVVGGSCWWGVKDTAPADDPVRKWLQDLLKETVPFFVYAGAHRCVCGSGNTFPGCTGNNVDTDSGPNCLVVLREAPSHCVRPICAVRFPGLNQRLRSDPGFCGDCEIAIGTH
jgi:hypothetical protein